MAVTPQEEARRKAEERYALRIPPYLHIEFNRDQVKRRDAFIAGYTADRWIDCKVRLPEPETKRTTQYLVRSGYGFGVCYFTKGVNLPYMDECCKKDWFRGFSPLGHCCCYSRSVTHWRPIEPPKTNEG